ncbi:MAG: DegV family protein, partial [Erysipelotrichaceae bacterium]|nr:DegV family protein [Erysipelotrichaceae bacterium]
MKLAFVTDTGTGRHPDEWKKEGIYCVPLQIECDGVSYDEMVTISYEQYIQ